VRLVMVGKKTSKKSNKSSKKVKRKNKVSQPKKGRSSISVKKISMEKGERGRLKRVAPRGVEDGSPELEIKNFVDGIFGDPKIIASEGVDSECIDVKYRPDEKLLASPGPKNIKKFKDQYKVWKSKLAVYVRNEVRTRLRPVTRAESLRHPKGPRLRLSSFSSRLSDYREAVHERGDVVNPMFWYEMQRFIDRSKPGSAVQKYVRPVLGLRGYRKVVKFMRDVMVDYKSEFNDREYNEMERLRSKIGHPVNDFLVLTAREAGLLDKSRKDLFDARNSAEKVKRVHISLYLEWMKKVLDNYQSHDWVNLAIALALATGRRPIELFATGSFSDFGERHAVFSGQAKGKLSDKESYAIPFLYDPKVCNEAMLRMRRLVGVKSSYDNDKVNAMTARYLADRMKDIFEKREQELFGDESYKVIEFYALRSCYVNYVSSDVVGFYDRRTFPSLSKFKADILGHSRGDYSTVKHYEAIQLCDIVSRDDYMESLSESQRYWLSVSKKQEEERRRESYDKKSYETYVRDKVESFYGKFEGREGEVYDFILDQVRSGLFSNVTPYKVSVKGQSPDKEGKYPNGQFNRALVKRVFDKMNLIVSSNVKKKTDYLIV